MKKIISVTLGIFVCITTIFASGEALKPDKIYDKYDYIARVRIEKINGGNVFANDIGDLIEWNEIQVTPLEVLRNSRGVDVKKVAQTVWQYPYMQRRYYKEGILEEGKIVALACEYSQYTDMVGIKFVLKPEDWERYEKQKEDGVRSFVGDERTQVNTLCQDAYLKKGFGEISEEEYQKIVAPHLASLNSSFGYNVEEKYELSFQESVLSKRRMNGEISNEEYNKQAQLLADKISKITGVQQLWIRYIDIP